MWCQSSQQQCPQNCSEGEDNDDAIQSTSPARARFASTIPAELVTPLRRKRIMREEGGMLMRRRNKSESNERGTLTLCNGARM